MVRYKEYKTPACDICREGAPVAEVFSHDVREFWCLPCAKQQVHELYKLDTGPELTHEIEELVRIVEARQPVYEWEPVFTGRSWGYRLKRQKSAP